MQQDVGWRRMPVLGCPSEVTQAHTRRAGERQTPCGDHGHDSKHSRTIFSREFPSAVLGSVPRFPAATLERSVPSTGRLRAHRVHFGRRVALTVEVIHTTTTDCSVKRSQQARARAMRVGKPQNWALRSEMSAAARLLGDQTCEAARRVQAGRMIAIAERNRGRHETEESGQRRSQDHVHAREREPAENGGDRGAQGQEHE